MEYIGKVRNGVTLLRYNDIFVVKYKGRLLFSQKILKDSNKMFTYYYIMHTLIKFGLVDIYLSK